jgi:hypothetical protein
LHRFPPAAARIYLCDGQLFLVLRLRGKTAASESINARTEGSSPSRQRTFVGEDYP